MNLIEWLAVLATILSVILLSRGKILGWTLGIVGCALYACIFIEQKLYANFILQLFFIIQGVYGLCEWNKNKSKDSSFSSTKIDTMGMLAIVTLTLVTSILINCMMFSFLTGENTLLDILLSAFSIVAMTMMIKKVVQAWFVWMLVDIGYIYLFLSIGLWVSAGLYLLLFLICIHGYINWKKTSTWA